MKLLQFRSVSKYWLLLISSPEFVKNHLLLSATNKNYTHHRVMIKTGNSNHDIKDCSVSSLLYDSVTEAFDLNYPGKKRDDILGLLHDLFLWYPSMRKYKTLPSYRRNHEDGFAHFNFGFTYDELQDDYKVVGFFPIYTNGQGHPSHVDVKIYSLKSDSWRRFDHLQGRELLGDSAKFVKGKLHWLDMQWNIISIDLTDEKWEAVEKPSCFERCPTV
ncbi:hypothetical protein P3S67_001794 [Capsicum chacoense]